MARRDRLKLLAFLVVLIAPIAAAASSTEERDPFEAINRKVFALNDTLDRWGFEPVARAWDFVLPDPVERSLERFFYNLDMPIVFLNEMLQAKPRRAGITLTRFAFNTTFGVAGLFDPAAEWGLERGDEDFGQTLGVWGVPAGPFVMLPIFGPYTVRDGVGVAGDWAAAIYPFFTTTRWTIGPTVVETVNWRAQSLEQIDNLRATSIDFYAAVRNGYLQRREAQIADRKDTDAAEEEDLYFFDDEEELE